MRLADPSGLARAGKLPFAACHQSAASSGMAHNLQKVEIDIDSGFPFHWPPTFWTQDFTVAPLPKMRTKVQSILDHWRWAETLSALDIHRIRA